MPDRIPSRTSVLRDGYAVEPFAEQDRHAPDDVLAFWAREGVVDPAEARRRLSELVVVATAADGALAGVGTAALVHVAQLRMDLWAYRGMAGREHRRSGVAEAIGLVGRDALRERFASGRDRRGAGVLFEVQNEMLKRHVDDARWWPLDFTFIGVTERGDHLRVHYFPGATVPPYGST